MGQFGGDQRVPARVASAAVTAPAAAATSIGEVRGAAALGAGAGGQRRASRRVRRSAAG